MHYIGWIAGSLFGTLLGATAGGLVGRWVGLRSGHAVANHLSNRARAGLSPGS